MYTEILSKKIFYLIVWLSAFLPINLYGQAKVMPGYLDSRLSTEKRVNDLVSRLSLAQKIKLMMFTSTAIDSGELKVPDYNWWNECLHGVARAGKATVFPQTIGLAATWNKDLVYQVSNAISDEARAKYNYFSSNNKRGIYRGLNFWTPNINIFRDPRWGRGMETYGEDPYLTGQLASSFIKGIQGDNPSYFKAIATVKHFAVHSGPEETRHSINIDVTDHDFYDTYTPAFKTCIQQGQVYSLMCAYNSVRGLPCCGNSFLLTDLLRNQWGFKGFIVTDCGAIDDFYTKGAHQVVNTPEEADAMAIKAGVDLECGYSFKFLDKAIAQGLLTEKDLDTAIKRLFTARFKLGFFDRPELNIYNNIPYSVVESKEHQQLSLFAAEQSAVLLKNQKHTLPISKEIKNIAVIGPEANDHEALLANYHGFPSTAAITPLEGLISKLPNTKITYAKGCRYTSEVPSMDVIPSKYLFADKACTNNGLLAKYYSGSSDDSTKATSKLDTSINFYWIDKLPASIVDRENFSVVWDGYIKTPLSGIYTIGLNGFDKYKLYINDSLIVNADATHEPNLSYKKIAFESGKTYKVQIKFQSANSAPYIQLLWEIPGQNLKENAINACKDADVIIMCMGLSPRLEGEEMPLKVEGFNKGDRTKLDLPAEQEDLIKTIYALGKPVVLVLVNGSALAINWENDHIPAILESWYGGQQAGNAIANILTGDYNPSGRLPVTFYKSEKQLPTFDNYGMAGRTYRYFNGKPLYSFGYGLSYSTYNYKDLKLAKVIKSGDKVAISVEVKNTGTLPGDEVVQLYVKNLNHPPFAAKQSLKNFVRIHLDKGESKVVKFILNPSDFSIIEGNQRKLNPGYYNISVGGQLADGTKQSNVITKPLKIVGRPLLLKM